MLETKSIFKSGTVWAIFFTVMYAIWPDVTNAFKVKKWTWDDTQKTGLIAIGGGYAIARRVAAKQQLTVPIIKPNPTNDKNLD